jgi:crotonobetainyl-CoA:carnitine CoA-transferase CaiB-like acyl-CoA transferase
MTELGLQPRGTIDFPDALVSLGMLDRSGEGYANTASTDLFLDRGKPPDVGGLLEMAPAPPGRRHRTYAAAKWHVSQWRRCDVVMGVPMLQPYQVLDLSGRNGWMAGFLLAQLGAEVVLAEPSGGYPRDSWFAAYNRGKHSVVVDGDAEVAALAAGFDVVIADGSPTEVAYLERLRRADPTLVTLAMTPFGLHGPKRDWRATDLTLVASSGQMAVTGDPDRPPVRTALPQAWMHACAEGVVAVLVALAERERSGLGQGIDCSVQAAMFGTSLSSTFNPPAGLPTAKRAGGGVLNGTLPLRWVYPTLDGNVVVSVLFGPMGGPFTARLVTWMVEEGRCRPDVAARDFIDFPSKLQQGEYSLADLSALMDEIEGFTRTKTKQQMAEAAAARSLLVVPVADVDDVLANPQLAARGYWEEVDGVRHPGAMVKASRTPLAPLPAAPAEPDSGRDVVHRSRPARKAPAGGTPDPGRKPLEGVKVLDLAWVAALPLATRIFAHWGATVIRVESVHRPDILRGALGHRDDIPEQENAIAWHAANAGKMGLTLNLTKPEAREVVKDLARWADVVTESFTPGTMAAMGFGYDELSALNPSLIMLSSCVMGQTGPMANFAGFGNLAAAVAGFFDLTGWPDRPPAGPYMAYTDFTSPRFSVMAVLAALDHRRRTGEGQYLDMSQMEAATHFLTPALLDRQTGATKLTRAGNVDPMVVPHAVYPAAGDDRWIAVVCETDEEWQSLCYEMRRDDLAGLGAAERLARRDELDAVVAAWTARQDAAGLTSRLQAHGIAAHLVSEAPDVWVDPQLVDRGLLRWTPHPVARSVVVDQPPYRFTRSTGSYDWAGPTYGQHTFEVLTDILGYDGDRIAELAVAEALE